MTDEQTEVAPETPVEEAPQTNTQEPIATDTKEEATDEIAAPEGAEATSEPEKSALPASVQKRLDRATFLSKSKNEENIALKNQLMQLQQRLQSQPPVHVPQAQNPALQAPNKNDFANPADYADALFAYRDQKSAMDMQQQQQQQEQLSIQNYLSELDRSHNERVEEAREKYADWDEVAGTLTQPTFVNHPNFLYLSTVLLSSPKSADLQYYFESHPNEALAILNKPPLEAAAEMGRVEMRLSAPPPKVTKAPAPPSKARGQSNGEMNLSLGDKRKMAFKRQQGL